MTGSPANLTVQQALDQAPGLIYQDKLEEAVRAVVYAAYPDDRSPHRLHSHKIILPLRKLGEVQGKDVLIRKLQEQFGHLD